MRVSKSEKEQALAELREIVKPGDTLTTVLRHVSRSGMSRRIDVYKFSPEPTSQGGVHRHWLSPLISRACGYSMKNEALVVGGCGMDMGFAVVYDVSQALYGRGTGYECSGDKCPSSSHHNGRKRNKGERHDDGYAVSQDWL